MASLGKADVHTKKKLKSILNIIVVIIVAIVGLIKVKHPLSYFIGLPIFTLIVYLLSNAMWTDLIFGETFEAKNE